MKLTTTFGTLTAVTLTIAELCQANATHRDDYAARPWDAPPVDAQHELEVSGDLLIDRSGALDTLDMVEIGHMLRDAEGWPELLSARSAGVSSIERVLTFGYREGGEPEISVGQAVVNWDNYHCHGVIGWLEPAANLTTAVDLLRDLVPNTTILDALVFLAHHREGICAAMFDDA